VKFAERLQHVESVHKYDGSVDTKFCSATQTDTAHEIQFIFVKWLKVASLLFNVNFLTGDHLTSYKCRSLNKIFSLLYFTEYF